jgi:hypothetical protein
LIVLLLLLWPISSEIKSMSKSKSKKPSSPSIRSNSHFNPGEFGGREAAGLAGTF